MRMSARYKGMIHACFLMSIIESDPKSLEAREHISAQVLFAIVDEGHTKQDSPIIRQVTDGSGKGHDRGASKNTRTLLSWQSVDLPQRTIVPCRIRDDYLSANN